MTTFQQRLVKSWFVGAVVFFLFVVYFDDRASSLAVFAVGTLVLRSLRRGIDATAYHWIPALSRPWQLVVGAYYVTLAVAAIALAINNPHLISFESRLECVVGFVVLTAPLIIVSIGREIRLFRGG